jgi:hypothetical protein
VEQEQEEEEGRGEELTSREEQWQEPSPSFRLEYLGGGSWNRVCKLSPNFFISFKKPKNRFQGSNSARLCSV